MRRARKGQAGNGQHNGDSSPVGQLVHVFSTGMILKLLKSSQDTKFQVRCKCKADFVQTARNPSDAAHGSGTKCILTRRSLGRFPAPGMLNVNHVRGIQSCLV